MNYRQIEKYGTTWEIDFLDNLGTYSEMPGNKSRLLRQYISAAHKRVNWEGIDRGKILNHARKLLSEI